MACRHPRAQGRHQRTDVHHFVFQRHHKDCNWIVCRHPRWAQERHQQNTNVKMMTPFIFLSVRPMQRILRFLLRVSADGVSGACGRACRKVGPPDTKPLHTRENRIAISHSKWAKNFLADELRQHTRSQADWATASGRRFHDRAFCLLVLCRGNTMQSGKIVDGMSATIFS